jgi:hypothetical protein
MASSGKSSFINVPQVRLGRYSVVQPIDTALGFKFTLRRPKMVAGSLTHLPPF